jgi:hypothetical protein
VLFRSYLLSPLGPLDLLHLCSTYHTVVLEGVPEMGLREREAARRLITFLDAAYEAGVAVYLLADREPENLFRIKAHERNTPVVRNKPVGGDHVGESAAERDGWFDRDPANLLRRLHRANVSDEPESGRSMTDEKEQIALNLAEMLTAHRAEREKAASTEQDAEEDTVDIMQRETIGAAMAITARDLAYRRSSPFLSAAEQSLIDKTRIDSMAIFTAEDEMFAFKRAGSRLREMGWSVGYWERSGVNRGQTAGLAGLGGGRAEGEAEPETAFRRGNDEPSLGDWGDEASYAGYLKQFTRHNPSPFAKEKMKPFGDWHFFGMQDEEDSWSVKRFFRQLRKRYEAPPASFKVREKEEEKV